MADPRSWADAEHQLNACRLELAHQSRVSAGLQMRAEMAEANAKDSRFLLAALIQKAGGRIELTMGEVIAIDANASIVTWDDVITGKKVYMLQTLTTSQSDAKGEL